MLGECHISFFILSALHFYLTLSILGCYSDLGVSANLHISFYPPYIYASLYLSSFAVLAWSLSRLCLEKADEVLRIFKAEALADLRNG